MQACAVTAVSSLSPSESSSDQITIVPSWRHMVSICSAYAVYREQMLGTAPESTSLSRGHASVRRCTVFLCITPMQGVRT